MAREPDDGDLEPVASYIPPLKVKNGEVVGGGEDDDDFVIPEAAPIDAEKIKTQKDKASKVNLVGDDEQDDEYDLPDFSSAPRPPPFDPDKYLPKNRDDWRYWREPVFSDNPADLEFREEFYPTNSLFPIVMDWMEPLQNTVQHRWSSILGLVGSLMGRGWRLRTLPPRHLMANLYVMNIGSSGSRKSIGTAAVEYVYPAAMVYTGSTRSDSAFLKKLHEGGGRLFWSLDEGSTLLGKMQHTNYTDLAAWLCSAYDGRPIDSDVKDEKGCISVRRPCLTVVTTSTPDSFLFDPSGLRLLQSGGLLQRFFLCPSVKGKQPPAPILDGLYEEFGAWLQQWARSFLRIVPKGQETPWITEMSLEAKQELSVWYRTRGEAPRKEIEGIWARGDIMAMKVALIYHAAQNKDPDMPIDGPTMVQAIKAVHHYVIPAHALVTLRIGASVGHRNKVYKVREALQAAPYGVAFNDLCLAAEVAHNELLEALRDLHSEIHYEHWMPVQQSRGAPSKVVVYGHQPLPCRPGERRVHPARAFKDPPKAVAKLLESQWFDEMDGAVADEDSN